MLRTLLITSLTLLVASCTTPVPDFFDCADLSSEGYCRHYISKKKKVYNAQNPYVSKLMKKTYPDWSKVPKVCAPIDEYVTRQSYMDKFCHANSALCANSAGSWNDIGNDLTSKIQERLTGK